MKPLPTLMKPLASVDLETGEPGEALVERSDVAAVEALAVVAEAAVAFELARAAREKFGGDALGDFVARVARVPRAHSVATHALNRHLVLVGFMGAGKSTIGAEVARRLGREFVDTDDDARCERARRTDEPRFRAAEARPSRDALRVRAGGHRGRRRRGRDGRGPRARCATSSSFSSTSTSRRVGARARQRPPARAGRGASSAAATSCAVPLYDEVADARAGDADDVVLAAAGVHVEVGALERLGELVDGDRPAPRHRAGRRRHPRSRRAARVRRSPRRTSCRRARRRSRSREVERLWRALRLGRDGTIVALGGGSLTDAAGFAAATYLRGVPWMPVPTTLIGQVDAAIGGKTAIDLPEGKNLVGAFHWPVRTVIDPALLETLPAGERLNGMAEVVKTGLLAGEPLWELPDAELVRRCAAFKSAVCLRDPHDEGPRHVLNLGHTFAHALEAAAGYDLPHGRAVALGLLAALRLSGRADRRRRGGAAPGAGARRPRPRVGGAAARQEGAAARDPARRRRRLRGRAPGARRPQRPSTS